MNTQVEACMREGCEKPVRNRGLCSTCYNAALDLVKTKGKTWDQLIKEGMAKPSRQGQGRKSKRRSDQIRREMLRQLDKGIKNNGAIGVFQPALEPQPTETPATHVVCHMAAIIYGSDTLVGMHVSESVDIALEIYRLAEKAVRSKKHITTE